MQGGLSVRSNSEEEIKQRILSEAVMIFSEKGFHGTSMREITSKARCSLPMLYYYYVNKEELFYELAYKEFVVLLDRLNAEVKLGETLQETYVEAVRQRKRLSPYDKAVYKLSLKVWLGFDGDSKVRNDVDKWEKDRLERTKMIFSKVLSDKDELEIFSNVMVRMLENMMMRIILFDEDISDQQISDEINFLIKATK